MTDFNDRAISGEGNIGERFSAKFRGKTRSIQHREYGRVPSKIWMGHVLPQFADLTPDAKLLYVYLLSSHHANMAGLYHLRWEYAAIDIRMTPEAVHAARSELLETELIEYDEQCHMVWVCDFLATQVSEAPLAPQDNRVVGLVNLLRSIGDSNLKRRFAERYSDYAPPLAAFR